MENQIRDMFFIALELFAASAIIIMSIVFTNQAAEVKINNETIKGYYDEIQIERSWRTYTGNKTGADVADFILRHKDMCDIVINDTNLTGNSKVSSYLTNGKLVMGLSDIKDIPEIFWDISFIYYNIIGGNGKKGYNACLLYDGQLTPEFDGDIQVIGGIITGIEFKS